MSAFSDAFAAAHQAASVAVGFTERVKVKQAIVAVDYWEPDSYRNNGSISKEYGIEYITSDLPNLAEGDIVVFIDADGNPIPKRKFKVRSTPYVSEDPRKGTDGTWHCADLTKL